MNELLAKVLYLLLMPSAAIVAVTFCSVSRVGILWKYAAWVVWLASAILVGVLVFDDRWQFDPVVAIATTLAVLLWSMFAVSLFMDGPLALIRRVLADRRQRTLPSADT